MKVKLLKKILSIAVLLFATTASSQITKNNWLVGGDAAFSYSKSKSDIGGEAFTLKAGSNIGHFFFDKIAFGIGVDYTLSRFKAENINSNLDRLLLTPFARYYFLEPDKQINVFLESSYRLGLLNENNSTEFSIKGSMAIFLNRNVAFEIGVEYLNSNSKNIYVGNNTVLLGFGVQVHLERE